MARKIMAKKKRRAIEPWSSMHSISEAEVVTESDGNMLLCFSPYPNSDFCLNVNWITDENVNIDESRLKWLANIYGEHLHKAYEAGKKHARQEIAEKYTELKDMFKDLEFEIKYPK